MGRLSSAVICATFSCMSYAWADTVPLAIPAPIPTADISLPSLPDLKPIRFVPLVETSAPGGGSGYLDTIAAQGDISAFGFACTEKMDVVSLKDATMRVTISAPCRPEEAVQISYATMDFDLTLSLTGVARFDLPAMAYYGNIDSIFDDYSVISTAIVAPELSRFARVALAWKDEGKAQLKAKAPRHLPVNVIILGDGSGRTVQVLSHHVDPDARSGVIRLSMVALVTDLNCDLPRLGHIVQHMPDMPPLRYDLTLAAAGCDRVGTNLELKNILQDLKLASN